MSVMQDIVLHQFTQFEVHRPFHSENMADFCHGVNWPGDLDL